MPAACREGGQAAPSSSAPGEKISEFGALNLFQHGLALCALNLF